MNRAQWVNVNIGRLTRRSVTGLTLCIVITMLSGLTTATSNVCSSAPCHNGGECIDLSSPSGLKKFECACPEGYEGITCQTRINPCASEPCENDGQCVPRRGINYHCVCTRKYHGKNCQSKKPPEACENRPCQPNGVCVPTNDGFICECNEGYHGPKCQHMDAKDVEVVEKKVVVQTDTTNAALIFLISVVVIIILIIALTGLHCLRVFNKLSALKAARERRLVSGEEAGDVPGWFETSNAMCADFLCCRGKHRHEHGVEGIIVPAHEYKSLVLNERASANHIGHHHSKVQSSKSLHNADQRMFLVSGLDTHDQPADDTLVSPTHSVNLLDEEPRLSSGRGLAVGDHGSTHSSPPVRSPTLSFLSVSPRKSTRADSLYAPRESLYRGTAGNSTRLSGRKSGMLESSMHIHPSHVTFRDSAIHDRHSKGMSTRRPTRESLYRGTADNSTRLSGRKSFHKQHSHVSFRDSAMQDRHSSVMALRRSVNPDTQITSHAPHSYVPGRMSKSAYANRVRRLESNGNNGHHKKHSVAPSDPFRDSFQYPQPDISPVSSRMHSPSDSYQGIDDICARYCPDEELHDNDSLQTAKRYSSVGKNAKSNIQPWDAVSRQSIDAFPEESDDLAPPHLERASSKIDQMYYANWSPKKFWRDFEEMRERCGLPPSSTPRSSHRKIKYTKSKSRRSDQDSLGGNQSASETPDRLQPDTVYYTIHPSVQKQRYTNNSRQSKTHKIIRRKYIENNYNDDDVSSEDTSEDDTNENSNNDTDTEFESSADDTRILRHSRQARSVRSAKRREGQRQQQSSKVDDGYASPDGRLSESDAGGRARDPQSLHARFPTAYDNANPEYNYDSNVQNNGDGNANHNIVASCREQHMSNMDSPQLHSNTPGSRNGRKTQASRRKSETTEDEDEDENELNINIVRAPYSITKQIVRQSDTPAPIVDPKAKRNRTANTSNHPDAQSSSTKGDKRKMKRGEILAASRKSIQPHEELNLRKQPITPHPKTIPTRPVEPKPASPRPKGILKNKNNRCNRSNNNRLDAYTCHSKGSMASGRVDRRTKTRTYQYSYHNIMDRS